MVNATEIKVFLADDHDLIREGLKKILRRETDITIAGEAGEPKGIIEAVQELDIDVLVLDLTFPEKSGLDILKEIKEIKPMLPVLILSMHPEERFATRAMKAGAAGYMTKETASEELLQAIRKVYYNGTYLSSSLKKKMDAGRKKDDDRLPHESLSDREFQVLRLMAAGKTQSDIAGELQLGISTINTYRSRILEKLQLSSTIELIHFAIVNKLID